MIFAASFFIPSQDHQHIIPLQLLLLYYGACRCCRHPFFFTIRHFRRSPTRNLFTAEGLTPKLVLQMMNLKG